MGELDGVWSSWQSQEETKALETAKGQPGNTRDITPKEALDFALEHSLVRQSTVREKELLTEAYHYAIGSIHGTDVDRFHEELRERPDVIIREWNGERIVTTHEVRMEELRMIGLARSGRCHITGVPRPLIDKFSRRTGVIEARICPSTLPRVFP